MKSSTFTHLAAASLLLAGCAATPPLMPAPAVATPERGNIFQDVAKAVYNLAKSVEDGKPESGIVRGDLKTGEVGLADSNPKFKSDSELQEAIETAKEKIISGEIKVKTS